MIIFPSLALLILSFAIIVNVLLGITVFRNNPQSKTNIVFAILCWVTSLWLLANHLSVQPSLGETTIIFMRMSIFFAVPQILCVFILARTLPAEEIGLSKRRLYLILLIGFLIMLLTISPLAFIKADFENGNPRPVPGPGMLIFALFAIFFSVGALYTLISRFLNSKGTVKDQLRYFMMGILAMFLLIITTIMIPVVLFNYNGLVPLSPLYTLIFLGSTTYAIVEHKLFNLKVFATEALTVIIWIVLLSKLLVSQSAAETVIDGLILGTVVIFGVLLVRSVMKEIEQRQKLQGLTERLKALDAQKDEFISMAAHELRAPMTAIKGYISMVLEGDAGDIPEKARGFLADANNINDRLVRLVNNMLNVSRIEEGRMVYQVEVENLSLVVRAVFNQFVPEAERNGLTYTLEIPSNAKDSVQVDPDRIQEVIGNLLSNAIKYTDHGSVKVRLGQPNESKVRFEVIDTGPGISEEEQGKLFQKFHRVETNIGKTTGTGLGLYISRLLVEKFGGKIGVSSKPGVGSTFWFELPLIDSVSTPRSGNNEDKPDQSN